MSSGRTHRLGVESGLRADRATLVRCPHCNQASGESCRTPKGVPAGTHVARVRLWQAMGCPGPAQMPKGRPTPKRPVVDSVHARLSQRTRRRERHRRHEDRRRSRAMKRPQHAEATP